MNKLNIGRRNFLVGGAALGVLGAMPALAISTDGASRFVNGALAELEGIVNSGQQGAQLQATLKGFFRKYADVPTVARAVLGAPWRGLSGSQQAAYVAAFENYVTKKYAQQFGVLKGGKAQITNVRDGGKAGVLVNGQFVWAGSSPVPVDMQVSDQSGKPKVLDLRLQGVSLIGTEREQVRALLAQNGNDVNALINALNAF